MTEDPSIAARWMVHGQLRRRGICDERVLRAMEWVPRHRFVPNVSVAEAYSDHALPTAQGQTISQPYIVARMTELLEVRPGMRVLEVGTGSGYQTAVLAELGAEVVSLERHEPLADRARRTLAAIVPEARIEVVAGDGTLGWPPRAPYDRILVTAGAPTLPDAYRHQLADPGRIVIPLGDRQAQELTLIDRHGTRFQQHADIPCRFVPLVGEQGWAWGEDA